MKIFETHFHLDMIKKWEHTALLDECRQRDICKMLTIAVSRENLQTVCQLTSLAPQLFGSQGIHPHYAANYSAADTAQIRANCQNNPKIVAIGEIGLDYYYQHASKHEQINAFQQQLQLAEELQLPVIIHSRDADSDLKDILKAWPNLHKKMVIHSFTASLDLAEWAMAQGIKLGINGICTFKNAENVRQVIALAPIESLLLETDAPYLAPMPHRGKENWPGNLPIILNALAQIKGENPEKCAEIIYQNSTLLFPERNQISD